ncbi:putative Ig domain-containing protein, partial [Streptomyces sp. NPDC101234]
MWGTGLPDGLTISDTGLISGTPTTLGTSDVTVTVTDDTGA